MTDTDFYTVFLMESLIQMVLVNSPYKMEDVIILGIKISFSEPMVED